MIAPPDDLEAVDTAPDDLEPVSDGPQTAAAPSLSPSDVVAMPEPPPDAMEPLFAGLEDLDSRLDPVQRQSFAKLDANSQNIPETRAHAINRAFLFREMKVDNPMTAANFDANWPAMKRAYAFEKLGIDKNEITDVELYGAIGKAMQEKKDIHVKTVTFWEGMNKSLIPWPKVPDDVPDVPELGLSNPALGAAIYKGIQPLLEEASTGLSLGLAGVGSELAVLGKTYRSAKAALATMTGVFTGIMGYNAVKGAPEKLAIIQDPNAKWTDKVTAGTALVAETGATLLGALGTALEAVGAVRGKRIAKAVEGKTPAEAAEVLREEAKGVKEAETTPLEEANADIREKISKLPEEQAAPIAPEAAHDFLIDAAYELDKIATPEDRAAVAMAATETPKPKPEYQYTVARSEPIPGTDQMSPAWIQIDEIIGGENTRSGNLKSLREEGIDLPDVPDSLPTGQYTTEQVRAASKGQTTETPLAAVADKPPVEGAVYSLKNADMDALMEREGLPPATKQESSTWNKAREAAAKKLESDHTAGQKLVEELKGSKRAVTDADSALLLHEEVRLALERKRLESDLVKAAEQGDPQAIDAAKSGIERNRKELVDLAEVTKLAGTESGRALAFRRAMMKEDYSLAAMETRRSVANEGRPLTEAQAAEVKALHEKLTAAEKKHADYRAKMSELLMSDEPGRRGPPNRLSSFISKQAENARERIKARMKEGRVMSGLDPIDLADHAIVGAEYIAKGVTKFAEWSGEMVKEFGEKITPHLKAIFDRSQNEHDSAKLNTMLAQRAKELEKSIAEKQEALRTGNLDPKAKKVTRPLMKELETLTQERDQLTKEIVAARKGPPATPEEKALKSYKTRTASRIKELEEKIAKSDFAKKERTPLHLDKEANTLKAQAEAVKLEFDQALERDRYANSSTFQKIKENTLNVYDTARLLMTTGELSFILRQGKVGVLSHPIQTAKALPNTFRALFADPIAAEALNMEVLNHPAIPAARAAKLHLIEEGASLNKQEELLMGKLVGKLPVIGKFNQAATVFMNRLRFDMWENMRKVGMTPAEEKQLAVFVNEATGRGSLGSLEVAAVPLGRLMFSPRYFASRIQLATGHSMWGGTLATRRIIAKEYAKTLMGLGLYYTALEMAFTAAGEKPEIGDDPRSSDFGKVKIGNSRLDPLAGVAQVAVFAARTASGEKANSKGKVTDIRGEKVPYGGDRWSDVAANFARSKLHPVPGAIVNLFDGTDLAGNKADLTNQALNLSAPVTYMDIYEALEEQDLPEGVALSLLALFGEGLQTYDSNKSKKSFRK